MTTTREHLRWHEDHDYQRITRGVDVDRLHAMDHKALQRRGAENHTHDKARGGHPMTTTPEACPTCGSKAPGVRRPWWLCADQWHRDTQAAMEATR
jgi:hypothetical protein